MKFIIGTKKEMTRLFNDDGTVVPVTAVTALPCEVTAVKTKDKDGYNAVQIGGAGERKKLSKPLTGILKGRKPSRKLREFRVDDVSKYKIGQVISVANFQPTDSVQVTGTTKGRGFTGVVKRHGFHGAPASHGTKDQLRMPGSSGATGPAHVFKGKKNPGQFGASQSSIHGLSVAKVDEEKNLIYIKGAVPGPRNGLLLIKGPGDMELAAKMTTEKEIDPKPVSDNKKDAPKTDTKVKK
ncbi:50S ribosomal protein L3 [Patescibacteria group bacterium]